MREPTDRQLIIDMQRGDRVAMEHFFRRYSPYLYAVGLRYVPQQEIAKDLTQDAFVKIFTSIKTFNINPGQDESSLSRSIKSWAARITANLALNYLRDSMKLPTVNIEGVQADEIPDDEIDTERLSSVLSIGSGVVYSRLTSTFTWGNSKATSFESKQRLNYIGVPVSIDYNLPSYKSAGFYITGGFMVEKCIYGETHLVYSPVTERVSEKAVQTSLFLGAGAEIKLNRHFSIYAEPLATFYIDNHSDIKNIYKDRPLNFDLRIGVRYNLK